MRFKNKNIYAGVRLVAAGAVFLVCNSISYASSVKAELETCDVITANANQKKTIKKKSVSTSEEISNADVSVVSKHIATAVDVTAKYRERWRALKKIEKEALTREDFGKLMDYLRFDYAAPTDGGRQAENSLKTDTLIILIREHSGDPEFHQLMVSQAQDETIDPIWREFVLQRYGGYLDQIEGNVEYENEIYAVLNKTVMSNRASGIAGTALIVLEGATRDAGPEVRQDLVDRALEIATDDQITIISRLTALQILGKMEEPNARGIALKIATSKDEDTTLRMVALATLGSIHSNDDETVELLKSFQDAKDIRLSNAANSALKRLAKPLANK